MSRVPDVPEPPVKFLETISSSAIAKTFLKLVEENPHYIHNVLKVTHRFARTITDDVAKYTFATKQVASIYLNSITEGPTKELLESSKGKQKRRRLEKDELKKLRASFDGFAAAIEQGSSADAWKHFGEGILCAFGLGIAISAEVTAQEGQVTNQRKAGIRTEKLQTAIRKVCESRNRKVSRSDECADAVHADVKKLLEADSDPSIKTYIAKKPKWPSAGTIRSAIEKMPA